MGGALDNGDMWILGLVLALAGAVALVWLRENRLDRAERRAEMELLYTKIVEAMGAKIDAVKAELEAKIDAVKAELEAKVDAVEAKVDAVEAKVDANAELLRVLSKRVGKLFERMASTEGLVEGLKTVLSHLGPVRERTPSSPSAPPSSLGPSDGERRSGRAEQESRL